MEETQVDSATNEFPQPEAENPEVSPTNVSASEDIKKLQDELNAAIEAKSQLTARARKAEEELKHLKNMPKENPEAKPQALDVDDYIDISAALEGLDQREKTYLAQQHKQTNMPLKDIRDSEDFGLWREAYRAKVEKEKALAPSTTQTESDKPVSLAEKLKTATIAEKEKLLEDAGLYKSPRPKADRVKIDTVRR